MVGISQVGICIPKRRYIENINIKVEGEGHYVHSHGKLMLTLEEVREQLKSYIKGGYTIYGYGIANDVKYLQVPITDLHKQNGPSLKNIVKQVFDLSIQTGGKRHIALEDAVAIAAVHT